MKFTLFILLLCSMINFCFGEELFECFEGEKLHLTNAVPDGWYHASGKKTNDDQVLISNKGNEVFISKIKLKKDSEINLYSKSNKQVRMTIEIRPVDPILTGETWLVMGGFVYLFDIQKYFLNGEDRIVQVVEIDSDDKIPLMISLFKKVLQITRYQEAN